MSNIYNNGGALYKNVNSCCPCEIY